jgi:dihydroorotase-like cyclic amidohydrolase
LCGKYHVAAKLVAKRGYPAEHFVDMVSSNAARIMGLYPRKGALAVDRGLRDVAGGSAWPY